MGERIKYLRISENMTQDELGEKIGVSRSSVGGYETAGRQPDLQTLVNIADSLGVTVDTLLGYSTEGTRKFEDSFLKFLNDACLLEFMCKLKTDAELQALCRELAKLPDNVRKYHHSLISVYNKLNDSKNK